MIDIAIAKVPNFSSNNEHIAVQMGNWAFKTDPYFMTVTQRPARGELVAKYGAWVDPAHPFVIEFWEVPVHYTFRNNDTNAYVADRVDRLCYCDHGLRLFTSLENWTIGDDDWIVILGFAGGTIEVA